MLLGPSPPTSRRTAAALCLALLSAGSLADADVPAWDQCSPGTGVTLFAWGNRYPAVIRRGPNARGECYLDVTIIDSAWGEWVPRHRVSRASDATCAAQGREPVLVRRDGDRWYESSLVEGPDAEGRVLVCQDLYQGRWQARVARDRVRSRTAMGRVGDHRCPRDTPVLVAGRDAWYAATIREGPNPRGQCRLEYDAAGRAGGWIGPLRVW